MDTHAHRHDIHVGCFDYSGNQIRTGAKQLEEVRVNNGIHHQPQNYVQQSIITGRLKKAIGAVSARA